MRVLLIGGSGFIGPHVARALLQSGHDVTVFHRGQSPTPAGARTIAGDHHQLAEHASALRGVAPDVVVDFILGSGLQAREVVGLFRGVAARIIALSSCDVYRACGVLYGTEPGPLQSLPLTESSDIRTALQSYAPDALRRARQLFPWLDDEYDKIPVEREVLGDRELKGTVLRLPMVYGPGDSLHRFKATLTRMASNAGLMILEEKHAAWRSPRGYVEDVAAAVALAATSPQSAGRVYNVAETESLSELEWAQQLADAMGWGGRFETVPFGRAPADIRMPGNLDQHWVVDSTRIRQELGYRELVSRPDAIARTIAWERRQP
jgi:nucleoside-diphosphate-sugar epimerase